MKKLFSLILAAAMLLCAATAFAAEGKIPGSAANLFFDDKAVVAEKSVVANPDWAILKNHDVEVAALGALFGSTNESDAVSSHYYQWLVMEGYGDTAGRYAEMTDKDPFSTDMDCVGAVVVLNKDKTKSDVKVTTVAAAYDDEQIKGIIAEYKCDKANSLVCYSVISKVDGKVYLYHFNAWGGLMEVTANNLFKYNNVAIPGTDASYQFTYGYTYKDKEYLSKNDLNEQIAKDKAAGTYSVKDKVTFGVLEAAPAGRNWTRVYPKLNFTRLVPSVADLVRGIEY